MLAKRLLLILMIMWPFTRDNAIKALEADTQFLKTQCGLLHQKILADLTILRDRADKRKMEIISIVALMGCDQATTVGELGARDKYTSLDKRI